MTYPAESKNVSRHARPDYFHLSFNPDIEGNWAPMQPAGYDIEAQHDKLTAEPSFPRISVSSSIEGCIRGVWANIVSLFTDKNYPYLDFWVYTPTSSRFEIVSNKDLTTERMVHDAHITGEVMIVKTVYMKRLKRIRLYKPDLKELLYYHAFDDKANPLWDHSPLNLKFVDL